MTRAFLSLLIASTLAIGLAAQQTPTAPDKKPSGTPKTLTLTGCVERGAAPNHYTIADDANGKYDVSGSSIQKFLGMRVEVAGIPGSTRFRVKGGLWPTPNVAAQAGAIDPAKAAIAAQPGGGAQGTGDVDLPTLKVRSVKTLDGGCK